MSARRVLKYPGSKWNIAGGLVGLIPEHHSYVEPYFGSGAVLFHKQPSAMETINDLDSDVTNLFTCIQKDSERLARLVMTTPFSREVYEGQFKEAPEGLYASKFQRAAGFLIKCWQGYGFRTNGYMAGWKNDVAGRERAYALWDWYRLPGWIIDIAERLRWVQIENRPALEVIKRFDYENVFMHLDPPYLLESRTGKQYKHEMTDADHEEMLKTILQVKAKVMVSGYESEMYNDYLHRWHRKYFKSCAEQGRPRMEVVWMNYESSVQMSLDDFILFQRKNEV
ncbi:DNA adenine methylase [Parablautia muri]|uniref:DNA adenine methylase n=1 Tax=Parablautia muri TaxID=2320879 RepID=A0A9X5BFQ3_9FIRM|nr:DNA adenine methylase [Parablautia muri]NBJ93226.1 DNA adenine methylase [Parablautia muri]